MSAVRSPFLPFSGVPSLTGGGPSLSTLICWCFSEQRRRQIGSVVRAVWLLRPNARLPQGRVDEAPYRELRTATARSPRCRASNDTCSGPRQRR